MCDQTVRYKIDIHEDPDVLTLEHAQENADEYDVVPKEITTKVESILEEMLSVESSVRFDVDYHFKVYDMEWKEVFRGDVALSWGACATLRPKDDQ